MTEDPGKVREIAWNEVAPWGLLVRCIRISLLPSVFALGTIGLLMVTGGWQVVTSMFGGSDDPVLTAWHETGCRWVWEGTSNFSIAETQTLDRATDLFSRAASGLVEAPVVLWTHMTRPFMDMFQKNVTTIGLVCLFLCGVWEILVWALIGGTITRIAALSLTRRQAPDVAQAMKFAWGSILSYTVAPLMALFAAGFFAAVLIIVGVLMRTGVIALLVGIVWPLVMLLGLLMAILLIGLVIGWPFMWATISVEGTDAFDAVSRSYAYTYQRPLRLLWYVLFGAVLGALGMFLVKMFALATIGLTDWSIRWGLGESALQQIVLLGVFEPGASTSSIQAIAAGAIGFWKSILTAIAAGYQAGYFWTATVGVYLLMRQDIDSAELDEVFIDDEEPDFGMPPLDEDESGVPEVATDRPAEPADT